MRVDGVGWRDLLRWAAHAAVAAACLVAAYVTLAPGTLVLGDWGSGSRAARLAWFAVGAVVSAGMLAVYPFVMWRATGRRAFGVATAVSVALVTAVSVAVAFADW